MPFRRSPSYWNVNCRSTLTLLSNAAVMPVPCASISRAQEGSWAAPASVLLVAAVSPFERPLNALSAGGFTMTTVELTVLIALGVGVFTWLRDPASVRWATPVTAPIVAVLIVVTIAALAAPEFRANALRFAGRLFAAAALCVLTLNTVSTRDRAGRVIATLLAVGSVVGILAVLELMQLPWVMELLRAFRPGFHVVGGQVRATSTLFYPTITSMYLEVVFALGLLWLISNVESAFPVRRPVRRSLGGGGSLGEGGRRMVWPFTALTLVGAGIIATFTRAGLITMTLSLAIAGGLIFVRDRRWRPGHTRLTALAGVLLILVLASRSPQMLLTRMSTEGSQDWYGAAYTVPATLTLRPDSFNEIPVTLANRGRITWQSDQTPVFALSYHWLTGDTEEVVIYDGVRTSFSQPVEPGGDVSVMARVRAPGYPGTYMLVWDVVQEHRTWLSVEGVYPGRTVVRVEGAAVTPPLGTHGRMPSGVMRVPRLLLWNTALAVTRDHPWLGIGADNFRHVYGRYLGLATWDTRVHANNSYLEALAGTGIVGLAAVAWLVMAIGAAVWQQWRAVSAETLPLFAAAAAAIAAIAVHGLVDSFLAFTSTYVVFAIAIGVMFSPAVLKSELSVSSAVARRAMVDQAVALDESVYADRV